MSTPFPHFPRFFFFSLIVYLPQTGREAAPFNAFAPPNPTKNFPHVPAVFKKRIKFSLCKWRGHGGSSGWVRKVWRVGRPLRKGSPCASKVFPSSPSQSATSNSIITAKPAMMPIVGK